MATHAETYTIESEIHPDGYFPDDTDIRIEWVADEYSVKTKETPPRKLKAFREKKLAWTGLISGKFTRQWDPGMYIWSAHKHTDMQHENFKETGAFLIGMDEDEWKRVTKMKPKSQHARMTTEGVTYSCMFVGCEKRTTSRIAAVLHEADHQGIDLLKNPELKEKVDLATEVQVPPKRGPGRPRKDAVS